VATAIRIPGIVDLIIVDDPALIRTLAEDRRLDRQFEPRGPVINRLICARIRRVLQHQNIPLPPVAPRDDAARAQEQARLETALDPASPGPHYHEENLRALAAFVHGENQALGPLVQEVIGRLVVPDYRASPESWAAALLLDDAVRSRNPFKRFWWAITGRVRRARELLAARVGGDRAGIHATGIAVHNLVESITRMRALYADKGLRERLSIEAVRARCLAPPQSVLRQSRAQGSTLAGTMRRGTLFMFRLADSFTRAPDQPNAFMGETWSRCPAHRFVPVLLDRVWREAVSAAAKGASR
jgi:hypothetical protein